MALDIATVESWLWEAACIIRGPVDAPKFKDYILPLIFLKRLSDVFEDEIKRMEQDFGSRQKALKLADTDHKLVRFFVPESARWANVAKQIKGVSACPIASPRCICSARKSIPPRSQWPA